MKLVICMILSFSSVASAYANACPNLSGSYSQKGGSLRLVITQGESNGITTYQITPNRDLFPESIADGIKRTFENGNAAGARYISESTYICVDEQLTHKFNEYYIDEFGNVLMKRVGVRTLALDIYGNIVEYMQWSGYDAGEVQMVYLREL